MAPALQAEAHQSRRVYISDLLQHFEQSPLAAERIEKATLEREHQLLGELLRLSVPEASHQSLLLAASASFFFDPFYGTSSFRETFAIEGGEISSHDPRMSS